MFPLTLFRNGRKWPLHSGSNVERKIVPMANNRLKVPEDLNSVEWWILGLRLAQSQALTRLTRLAVFAKPGESHGLGRAWHGC